MFKVSVFFETFTTKSTWTRHQSWIFSHLHIFILFSISIYHFLAFTTRASPLNWFSMKIWFETIFLHRRNTSCEAHKKARELRSIQDLSTNSIFFKNFDFVARHIKNSRDGDFPSFIPFYHFILLFCVAMMVEARKSGDDDEENDFFFFEWACQCSIELYPRQWFPLIFPHPSNFFHLIHTFSRSLTHSALNYSISLQP